MSQPRVRAMPPEEFYARLAEAQAQPKRTQDVKRRHLRSWIIWAGWVLFGLLWEFWCLWRERQTGDEPLTRVTRDRAFHEKYVGPFLGAGVLFFLVWLIVHWFVPSALGDGPPSWWRP